MSAHIEEVSSDHSEHEHDHDHDHDHDHEQEDDPTSAAALEKIQSRSERKARKALLGLGLKKSYWYYSGNIEEAKKPTLRAGVPRGIQVTQ